MLEVLIKLINEKEINKKALIKLIPELDILEKCECNHPAHCYGVFDHTIEAMKLVNSDLLKIVLLFHDLGKPVVVRKDEHGITRFWGHSEASVELTNKILDRINLKEDIKKIILTLIKYHDEKITPDQLQNMVDLLGKDTMDLLIQVKKADLNTHAEWYRDKRLPELLELEKTYNNLLEDKKYNIKWRQ